MKNLILFIAFAFLSANERSAPMEMNKISSGLEVDKRDASLCRGTAAGLFTDLECVQGITYNFQLFGSSCNTSYCITIISGGTLNDAPCKTAVNGDVAYSNGWSITATGTEPLWVLVEIFGSGGGIDDITTITVPNGPCTL